MVFKERTVVQEWAEKVFPILLTPSLFATRFEAETNPLKLSNAFLFYTSILAFSATAWVFLLYFWGTHTSATALFSTVPEIEKLQHNLIAVALTLVPSIVLYLLLKLFYGRRLTFRLFAQVFFYSAGAVLIIITFLALITGFYVYWSPANISESMARKLTLLEAIGYPALCDQERSIECQINLRLGPDAQYYLAAGLITLLIYQILLMTAMINSVLSDTAWYPLIVTALLLIGGFTFGMQALSALSSNVGGWLEGVISYSRCANYLQQGQPEKAKDQCQIAVERRPRFQPAQTHLCASLVELKEYGGGLRACDAAVEIATCNRAAGNAACNSPFAIANASRAYLARADAHRKMGALGKALVDLTASAGTGKQQPFTQFMLGEVNRELRRYADAVASYDQAEKEGLKNSKLYVGRAKARVKLGQEGETRADLANAEAQHKNNVDIPLTWAAIHKNRNESAASFARLEEALKLDARNGAVYSARCDIFDGRSNLDAISDCDQAVRLRGDAATIYFYRGRVHARMVKPELARANYLAGFALLSMQIMEKSKDTSYMADNLGRATDLGNLSFAALLAGDYKAAGKAAAEALELAKDELWIEMNGVHAIALATQANEEKAFRMYIEGRGKMGGGQMWDHMLSDDFRWLRSAVQDTGERQRLENLFDKVERALDMKSSREEQW